MPLPAAASSYKAACDLLTNRLCVGTVATDAWHLLAGRMGVSFTAGRGCIFVGSHASGKAQLYDQSNNDSGLLLMMGGRGLGQVNLVMNGDFEQYSKCPDNINQIKLATNWSGIDTAEQYQCDPAEYCHTCADWNKGRVSVPESQFYYQHPHSGNGFAMNVFYTDESVPAIKATRNYVQGKLAKKLIAGKQYCVSFYVSFEESSRYAVKEISAYLDNGTIDTATQCDQPQTKYKPQINNSNGIITDTFNWIKIDGSFVANGTEQFITIGNFKDKANTAYVRIPNTGRNTTSYWSHYLIEDVSVVESGTKADAGPDTHVGAGGSVYIGRPMSEAIWCDWRVLGSSTIVGQGPGIWVKPTVTTRYEVTQTLCGVVTKDTVRVEVWTAGVTTINGVSQQYSLSPNPTKGSIILSQSVADERATAIEVSDATGRKVFSSTAVFHQGQSSIDLNALAPGFYTIRLRDRANSSCSLRFVKE